MAVNLIPRRITVDEYQKMAEVGILAEDERTELINGEIIQMSAIGGDHVEAVSRLIVPLVRAVGTEWRVNPQSPIALPPYGEPEPDFSVVRARSYRGQVPRPDDVLLVIEVSDTSLRYDRETKLPMYAEYGIPEAWIVDINGKTITRYSEPVSRAYAVGKSAGPGMELGSIVLPALTIRVDEILDL